MYEDVGMCSRGVCEGVIGTELNPSLEQPLYKGILVPNRNPLLIKLQP